MSPVNYQTIKLSKGKHSSPEDGACVMELASMLAGEPFSDHPASVCPAIGSFLRAYNDSVGDARRQDLYEYASRLVGTRGRLDVQRERSQRLVQWAGAMYRRGWRRFFPLARLTDRRLRPGRSLTSAGTYAAHAIGRHSEESHREVLALLDELLQIGSDPPTPACAPVLPQAPDAAQPAPNVPSVGV
ncbi:MAG TPA: hypothetical protein VE983_12470 [Solirubrobacteraceae bacterium]|nr:hypothetical protein [Solirubrobacteraceae bacterium]